MGPSVLSNGECKFNNFVYHESLFHCLVIHFVFVCFFFVLQICCGSCETVLSRDGYCSVVM